MDAALAPQSPEVYTQKGWPLEGGAWSQPASKPAPRALTRSSSSSGKAGKAGARPRAQHPPDDEAGAGAAEQVPQEVVVAVDPWDDSAHAAPPAGESASPLWEAEAATPRPRSWANMAGSWRSPVGGQQAAPGRENVAGGTALAPALGKRVQQQPRRGGLSMFLAGGAGGWLAARWAWPLAVFPAERQMLSGKASSVSRQLAACRMSTGVLPPLHAPSKIALLQS